MRTGISMIQKALTPESAAVVKQSVTLARRRGHAQVTPLHVASTMLASPTGLLRTSCLSSHSHPLQCKALELCFNVALNRLPSAAASGPILGGGHYLSMTQPPSLSNALVAVFKRAQAHQRRGSVESQQQPILALKIELEQLVISILDDPSVSRVMREAGFSSSHVKTRVEQAVSIEVLPARTKKNPTEPPHLARTKSDEEVSSGDIVESMLGKKRNTVVIGESIASAESAVRTVIKQLESKSSSLQFISFPILSTRNLSRDETERKLNEIREIIRTNYTGRNIILYLGDIEGVSEDYYLTSLENVVMEIKRWCCGINETKRVFVLGVATSDSYKKIKFGQPSLETVWELHPLNLPPSRNLALTLNLNSDWQAEVRTDHPKKSGSKWKLFGNNGDETEDDDVQSMSEKLPQWLQQYKVEKTLHPFTTPQANVNVKNLCKKWSSFSCAFRNNHKLLGFSSTPCSPTASSPSSNFLPTQLTWPRLVKEEVHAGDNREVNGGDTRPDLLSNPNSSPNSASSSEIMEDSACYSPAFDERTAKNAKILTDALEAKVPWQRDVIPEMVDTVLSCRSRKCKETTWIAISGPDSIGKEKFARELGKLVYGSHACFVSVTGAGAITESSRKRAREETAGGGYLRIFGEAVNENPHRVFFLEGFDRADEVSKVGIRKAIRSGKLSVCGGESVSLRDAIVIITYESSDSRPKRRRVSYEEDGGGDSMLDLNIAIEDHGDDGDVASDVLDLVDGKFIFEIQVV